MYRRIAFLHLHDVDRDGPRLERELAAERERLDLAIKAAGIGVWEYCPGTGEAVLDAARERQLPLVASWDDDFLTIPAGTPGVRVVVLTGWAVDSGSPWRRNGPSSLPLSDHAGFDDLMEYVKGAAPKIVYTVHGNGGFAAHLRRQGIEAVHLGQ